MHGNSLRPAGLFPPAKLRNRNRPTGSAYVLCTLAVVVLTTLGIGMLATAWQTRHRAIKFKSETASMLAAEAGYEQAVYWMSRQKDMLSALRDRVAGTSGALTFPDGSCKYEIGLYTFVGARPVYRVVAEGSSGVFSRTVNVLVIQAISGWDMGICRVPYQNNSTWPVYFAENEIVDVPLHINDLHDSPDNRDIYIKGSPQFLQAVGMGESRYTDGDADKYGSVLGLFDGGICFDQPDSRITDEVSIAEKIDRFRESTDLMYRFKPAASAGNKVKNPSAAVQFEFFVSENGTGKVRITNNCTVRGFKQAGETQTWDYRVKPGTDGEGYERYEIYSYHVVDEYADATSQRSTHNTTQTYVTQIISGVESEPGGQIYVDGDVIIGGDMTEHDGSQLVKGKVTVVASGNIWIGDSITVDGSHDAEGKPSKDNPNILGLIALGVVKVVDPGMSDYDYVDDTPVEPAGYEYAPIGILDEMEGTPPSSASGSITIEALAVVGPGIKADFTASHPDLTCEEFDSRMTIFIDADQWTQSHKMNGCTFKINIPPDAAKLRIKINADADDYPQLTEDIVGDVEWLFDANEVYESTLHKRHLPDPMVVEASITVGGGGWGAEHVERYSNGKYYGGRKEADGSQDFLVVRGTITEAIRGVVGLIGKDGYYKQYYLDQRLLQGILPGDIWLRGKYIPAPAGWHDYRSDNL